MKIIANKKILLLVFLFFKSCLFAMQEPVASEVEYDVQAYERLLSYSKGVNRRKRLSKNKNFSTISLENEDLSKASFRGCCFDKSIIKNVEFLDTILDSSTFINSFLSGISFIGANLSKVDFSKSVITNSLFSNGYIQKSNFHETQIINSKFANMRVIVKSDERDTNHCKMKNDSFNFADFKFCTFRYVGFSDNEFIRSGFKNTLFKKCVFFRADFKSSSMQDVLFEKCIFVDCDNLDKIFFGENVNFNFCKFQKSSSSTGNIEEMVKRMKNLGAIIDEEPGSWEKFKKYAGAIGITAAKLGLSYATGGAMSLGSNLFSKGNNLTEEKILMIIQEAIAGASNS